jgi:hypothetical protein
VSRILNGTQDYARVGLLERLNESLGVLATRDNGTLDGHNNKMYTYALMDWRDDRWEPILAVIERRRRRPLVQQLTPSALASFNVETPDLPSCDDDADCPGEPASVPLRFRLVSSRANPPREPSILNTTASAIIFDVEKLIRFG